VRRAFWVDDAYALAVVRPARAVARAVLAVDHRGIDTTAVGAGRSASLLGAGLRRLQNGNVQAYLSALVLGVIVVVVSVSVAVVS
jgi:NADH-quinone oxidoreductase subunit L